jgi:DNA-binding GntR family transcriptional regulator
MKIASAPDLPAGKGLHHRTMSAAAAEQLRRRILNGSYPAGHALRQDALAEEFGVSRIPVREALMQLEAEGLVKIVPHRGAIVAALSPDEVIELFELRALLEPELLKLSGPKLGRDDYARLEAILAEYSAELRARHVSRWGELNTTFHMLLYRHAGRPRSLALVSNLLRECDRHARVQLAATNGIRRAEEEHAELVRLCQEGEFASASALLKAHIENVSRSLRSLMPGRAG